MSGYDESSSTPNPPFPKEHNAFRREFLQRVGEHDEPVTAGEAEVAGRCHLEEVPGAGWGLFRAGERSTRGFRPVAVFRSRSLTLLAAAILPGTGRDPAFHLALESEAAGFPVRSAGEVVGHLALFDDQMISALHVVEMLVRSPESLAYVLEAAGAIALERTGTILDDNLA